MEDDDVENKTEASTSKVTPLGKGSNESIYGFSDSDSTDHLPWSSENLSQDRIKKAEQGIEEHVHYEFDGVMYDTDDDRSKSVNAPVVAVDALVLPVDAPVIALEEQLERV
nr:hypothetical protein [Tanacetum cinerariifolium]